MRIDASNVGASTNCPNNRVGNGSSVNLVGVYQGVEAVQPQCTNSSTGVVVDVSGMVSQVSTDNGSFTPTLGGMRASNVIWGPLTLFDGVTPDTLDGKNVEVIGLNDTASGSLLAVYVKRFY